jgi:phosphoribosylanthranilate isomerase
MRVKHCGITSVEDAELCVAHGAWALGLIFVPGVERACPPEQAAVIAGTLRRRTLLTGVFRNATLDAVVRAADEFSLAMVQLHGDEGPSFATAVAQRTGARVVKAARVRTRADVLALAPFRTDFHLFDGPGGGEPFEWSLARVRRGGPPLIAAGGLTAENVAACVAATRPFAVDVASGTEAAPGVKDPDKVAAFAAAAADARPPSRPRAEARA